MFDVMNTVRMADADTTGSGVMAGFTYFTTDEHASVFAIDVRTGLTAWTTPLTGSGSAGAKTWTCGAIAVDTTAVYAIASNYDNLDAPARVTLTAIDQATGDILWHYSPPTTQVPVPGECGDNLGYAITPTAYGLLLNISEMVDGSPLVYSEMLSLASGDIAWRTDTVVHAAASGAYGIATSAPAEAADAVAIDLSTGEPGAAVALAPPDAPSPAYSVLGQVGDDLIVSSQTLDVTRDPQAPFGTTTTATSVFRVSAVTGLLQPKSEIQLADTDLNNCTMATDTTLVCDKLDDATTAVGISLSDGATRWQHAFTDDQSGRPPLLFNGYMYGTAGGRAFVLDADTGALVHDGTFHQPIAVNQTGMVFSVSDTDGYSWQCWWAPAVG